MQRRHPGVGHAVRRRMDGPCARQLVIMVRGGKLASHIAARENSLGGRAETA